MHLKALKELPLMGILRGAEEELIEPLLEAAALSGLRVMEITMNTPNAAGMIRCAVRASAGRVTVGAGTVLDMDNLRGALDAGARFIVSPVLVKDVVEYCVKNSIPVFPGALTPQEIYGAWRMGASMVKVFPAKLFGPGYFKEIKGPFADIELLACGGVTPDNIGSFFSMGASAAAFGASVFRKEWLKARNFREITSSIQALVSEVKAAR